MSQTWLVQTQKVIVLKDYDSLPSLLPDYNVTTALAFLQATTEMAH